MNPRIRISTLIALVLSFFSVAAVAQTRPIIAQTLGGFTRPTSAVFSTDSKYLFVVNHAQGESGTLRNESFLSKLAVDEDGVVTPSKMRFVHSLTAPIDLDFSPVRFGKIPVGAIFMVMGSPLVQDEAGRALKDVSRIVIGLLVIDPKTGRTIKMVDLSPNSRTRLGKDGSLLSPTSICFDSMGNLYIGESGIGGHMFDGNGAGRPGIWRLETEAVNDLLTGVSPRKVEFIQTTSVPGDLNYREKDDLLYFVTNHSAGAPSGSVFMIKSSNYEGLDSMQTIVRGIGALSGIQITPTGHILMVGNSGDLMFPKGRKNSRPIRFRPKMDFSTPGKISLTVLRNKTILVAVPEQSSEIAGGGGQRVSIVKLPSNY